MYKYKNYVVNKFIAELNEIEEINKVNNLNNKVNLESDIWKFRFICYELNNFIKKIPLPPIKSKNFYEAVLVEFRILPNIEFILRNAILKLGSSWSFTIVCGINNYEYIYNICKNIDKHINIICLEYNNLTQEEYSVMLTNANFWDKLYGEKILIYQEDSLIFNSNISPFLKYDYIGAPFAKNTNDTPNGVGNGGLSLRTKCKMLEIIKKFKLEDLNINSSTRKYMDMMNLKFAPEDVYFSKNMQEKQIGDVADWNTAFYFSSEQVFNPKSFAGHKFWISNNKWKTFMKSIFNYKIYNPQSDLNKYLKFKGLPLEYNKNQNIKNAFDVDLKFFCCVNNIEYIDDINTLEYIKNMGLDGFIYHPKQLYNIFKPIELYQFLNNIYIFTKNSIYTIQEFVNKHLYNSSFDYLADLLIKKKYDILNNNYGTYIFVFLGNMEIALDILNRIIDYKKINNKFNVAFCINTDYVTDIKKIKNIIKSNFDFYAIYYTKELGTDITPTILMYNDIIITHEIRHIIKLHTKTISNMYIKLTDYLLKNSLEYVISNKKQNCNCIGEPSLYYSLNEDMFNSLMKLKYSDKINLNNTFVAGTIFYAENIVFYRVLEFIKNNNFRAYFLNNLYENNSINQEFSPIHFLERLFGVIKL